jgi:MFS family permease
VDYSFKPGTINIHNWAEQLNLYCADGSEIAMIGSMCFAGWAAALLVIPPFSSCLGRKPIVQISLIIFVITISASFLVTNLTQLSIVMFVMGFACSGRDPMALVYACEFMTPS